MSYPNYPTDLTDRQWAYIKDRGPAAKPGGRPRTLDMRQVVNAILYLVVTGCQWRALPHDYPKWPSVYTYFRRWRADGPWQRIPATVRAALRGQGGRHKHPTAGCLASQRGKTAAGPGGRGYDAGKHVMGRKRPLRVDPLGWVLTVVGTAAARSDAAGARQVFKRLGGAGKQLHKVGVAGTYRGKVEAWVADHLGILLEPVLRPDGAKGFVLLPRRWAVERTFAWLTQCRRLSKDYEGLPASSEALIYIAMTRLMVRRLAA